MASLAPSSDSRRPALSLFAREAGEMLALRWKSAFPPRIDASARVGDGHPVLVVPGFLASDQSTIVLRRALKAAGYRAHGWKLGMNWGARADMLDRIEARLERVARDRPASLVGWSLGGLYAREVAKRRPDLVARVVTLGSPFSGDMRANNAWWLYEMLNGHRVDAPPLDVRIDEKPPVPTVALWSRSDGIVAPACARGQAHECDRAVEVACSHMGFVTDPCVVQALLSVLAD